MDKYHVTYYYLGTGGEGRADEKDYGIVKASSAEEAKEIIILKEYPQDKFYGPRKSFSERGFMRGFLKADKVNETC